MIKTVIFDWGGVLIDNPADGLMQYCANSLDAKAETFKNIYSTLENKFQKGAITEDNL